VVHFDVTTNLDQLTNFTHNLCKLDLSSWTGRFYSVEEVMVLGNILPDVKDLKIGLNNDGFRAVCGAWPSLKSLSIRPCSIDEDAFLGVQEGEMFRLPNIMDLEGNLAQK